jgi:hypothetical protein
MNTEQSQAAKPALSQSEVEARAKIGRRIVYWALSAVSILGLAAMFISVHNKDEVQPVKDILSMLLPMIGAWVGTVLAFYFSKENYVAAAESNAQVLGMTLDQRLQSTPVNAVMIPFEQVQNRVVLDRDPGQLKLRDDILGPTALATGRNRIMVTSDRGVVKYVVHRSIIDRFTSDKAFTNVAVANLTLADFLDDANCKAWATSFGTVGPSSRLDAAKAVIDANPKCSDVIVTADGSRDTKAVGWLTNAIVLEKSRA